LTDFLAANNISAAQISADYQRRLDNARQNAAQSGNGDDRDAEEEEDDDDDDNDDDDDEVEDAAEQKKRKRKEEKTLQKIKQTKEFKRRKHESRRWGGSDDSDDNDGDGDGDGDHALARSMMPHNKKTKKKVVRLPGQLDNCELCGKRFTVTPYSKAGPAGGLLCPKCSKEAKDDEKARQKAAASTAGKKKTMPRARRRQTESDRLMGDVRPGAKSLVDCCVRKVADVVTDIDDFGDMPQRLLDRLSQILSKKRVLTPRTLRLFLRADCDTIDVYDSGKLEEDDFQRIFAHMGHVGRVNLRFAGQLKDGALLYMADKCTRLRHLQLGAANLISDAAWSALFVRRGAQLESLKLSELNDSLRHDIVLLLSRHCTQLRRLKLRACTHMTDASSFDNADDSTLAAIHTHCCRLSKLRITGSSQCTDTAFASLFTSWPNPPLPYLDLSSNRDVDEVRADGALTNTTTNPADQQPIGLGSAGLKALMRHSGNALQRLDLHSNRHIGIDALLDVFDGQAQYPALRDIDLSFVATVDDVVMRGIFRSCPKLKKLALFACFNARGAAATIPAGVAVVGLPNAHDHIVQGDEGF
ncbi:hypothetical protein DV736_g1704, partial [Chaetothyriales sp. CBS 134916]